MALLSAPPLAPPTPLFTTAELLDLMFQTRDREFAATSASHRLALAHYRKASNPLASEWAEFKDDLFHFWPAVQLSDGGPVLGLAYVCVDLARFVLACPPFGLHYVSHLKDETSRVAVGSVTYAIKVRDEWVLSDLAARAAFAVGLRDDLPPPPLPPSAAPSPRRGPDGEHACWSEPLRLLSVAALASAGGAEEANPKGTSPRHGPRLCRAEPLHKVFMDAVASAGGLEKANPKGTLASMRLMCPPGLDLSALTEPNIKSHLRHWRDRKRLEDYRERARGGTETV
jgi:SHAQKYF class myb-like DNA-binding protein